MKGFKELLMKKAKSGEFLDEKKIEAKREVLEALQEMIKGEVGGKLGEMKKVTVASPTKEGLQEGLEKAEEVIEKMPKMEEMEEMEEGEKEESRDEIEEKIKELEEKLAKMDK